MVDTTKPLLRSDAKWRALFLFSISVITLSMAAYFLSVYWESIQSRDWPHVRGSVVKNYTTRTCGNNKTGKSWEARVVYRYVVDGYVHEAERVGNAPALCDDNRLQVEAWLDMHYPVGKAVDVYYNPARRNAAFLRPGDVGPIDAVMISAALLFSALMAFAGWRSPAMAKSRSQRPIFLR